MRTLLFLLAFLVSTAACFATSPLRERWIYCSTNLLNDKNVDDLGALFQRAEASGYNGVLLNDWKFGKLNEMDAHYFANVARVKTLAAQHKLRVVPALFPVGYSDSILSQDPNLAEGLPVKDAPLVVHDGMARAAQDPAVQLHGGDLRDWSSWPLHDDTVALEDGTACVIDPHNQNARLMQSLKLSPFQQYHLAVDVKTENVTGAVPEAVVLAKDGTRLTYSNLGVSRNGDWKTYHMVFNTLGHSEVNIYFGSWGMNTGIVRWRNPKLEVAGPVNLLRRGGAPLAVSTEDGKSLVEGKDFEPVLDPKMGNVPWKGEFEVWHEAPPIRTHLPEGTRLRVSYYHAITVYDGQVMICPSEPATMALLRDQARRMHAAWGASAYCMSHDEIRVLNWDKSCTDRNLSPGAILAENVRACTAILREVNPGGQIYVWSDMFDPTHNAKKDYFLVNGDLTGSWLGLDKDIRIILWNYDTRAEGMKFFAGLGNPMLIAGYYDSPVENVRQWLQAARPYPAVEGVMYTTWENNYRDLEAFSTAATAAP